MQKDKKYIDIKFYKLWQLIRLSRQQKEGIKNILFSTALFKRFLSYQNWKDAQIFADKKEQIPVNKPTHAQKIKNKTQLNSKFAIVIHVFYLDVFNEILSILLTNKTIVFKLFITCPNNLRNDIETNLKTTDVPFQIMIVENHGRDILPFLKILPQVFEQGFNLVLKVHTKRSTHLNKKDLWSTELFEELLSKENMQNALSIFSNHPEIGMIGPSGHILPMSLYYGGNAANVESLCIQMGLQQKQLSGMNFVAGSMFYARKDVLLPILNLNLRDNDFEDEDKQLDNTLAHTLERVFSAGLIVSGLELSDSSSRPKFISCQTTLNHPFTI